MERGDRPDAYRGSHKRKGKGFAGKLAITTSVTLITIANGLSLLEYKDEHEERVELQEVYPSLGEQLYYQGYPEIMRLKIDVGEDTFTFMNLSDEKGPSVCSGVYEYKPHTALKIGQILCVELEDPGTPPSEPVSL